MYILRVTSINDIVGNLRYKMKKKKILPNIYALNCNTKLIREKKNTNLKIIIMMLTIKQRLKTAVITKYGRLLIL